MKRLGALGLMAAILGVLGLAALLPQAQQTAPAPLFIVGRTYAVVVDCLPLAVVPPQVDPCFTEPLTVTRVRSDNGWIVTETPQGAEWTINPARIYAVQLLPLQREPVSDVLPRVSLPDTVR